MVRRQFSDCSVCSTAGAGPARAISFASMHIVMDTGHSHDAERALRRLLTSFLARDARMLRQPVREGSGSLRLRVVADLVLEPPWRAVRRERRSGCMKAESAHASARTWLGRAASTVGRQRRSAMLVTSRVAVRSRSLLPNSLGRLSRRLRRQVWHRRDCRGRRRLRQRSFRRRHGSGSSRSSPGMPGRFSLRSLRHSTRRRQP